MRAWHNENGDHVYGGVVESGHIHLIKLCVGADSFEDQANWMAARQSAAVARGEKHRSTHVTRMFPKRGEALLRGGSLYWVIKGFVLARQRIVALEPQVGADGISRCAIVMEPTLIRTQSARRRPFQGWRYLDPQDAPPDLPQSGNGADAIPVEMALALADLGLR